MKKVMVFGTFDFLHEGHVNFFQQAREFGDHLIVVVARDKTLKGIKQNIVHNEKQRLAKLKELMIVDEPVLGDESNVYKVVQEKMPDTICLGYDQTFFTEGLTEFLKENNLDIPVHRLKPHKEDVMKSSKIKAQLGIGQE